MEFTALLEPDLEKGGFVVTFPDFEWGVTQGETESEAIEMATDALLIVLDDYIREGREIPAQKIKLRGRKVRSIRLPLIAAAKVELYRAFRESGMKKAELARRLNSSKGNIDRLFDVRHQSRVAQLEAAFAAIGKEVYLEVRDAA